MSRRSLLALALSLGVACKDKGGGDSGAVVDADGDGTAAADDCDDADAAIHPGADELDDGIDNDCDGVADEYQDLYDDDGDGWTEAGGDCDDADAAVSPDADEVTDDEVDNDCDDLTDEGADYEDDDGDGYSEVDGDCDDTDPEISPDATEIEDQVDNDCDGVDDEGTRLYDDDGDGYTETFGDCNDEEALIHPGAEDTPYDGVDADCGMDDDYDADGDGARSADYEGTDCDDADAAVYPGADEACDGADNDCDGQADDGVLGDESCPAASCLEILVGDTDAEDGLYWIDPLAAEPDEVWCDMAGGGWTLVARATNAGGVAENGTLEDGLETGTSPITPESTGNNKLSDDVINALRSAAMPNDLKVVVTVDGALLGESWHPNDCVLQTGVEVEAAEICNASTTGGADDLNYVQSEHPGPLTRWYVDADFGYIWSTPGVHIGPVEGGTDHEGSLPDPYCTWYDERVCPLESSFELWAL